MKAVLLFFLAVCAIALAERTAVDLWFREDANSGSYGPGYISLPSIKLGSTGAIALEANCFLQRIVSNERNQLFFLGRRAATASSTATARSTSDDIEVILKNQGSVTYVAVRLGGQEFTSTRSVNVDKTWAYIAVNVFNRNGAGFAQIYINGVLSGEFQATTFVLNSFARDYSFMGYSPSGGRFRGLVDTVQIWDQALTLAAVETNAAFSNGEFPWSPTGLIVRFDFTETTGSSARGRIGAAATGTYAATLDVPRAVFSNGGSTGWFYCYGWGDPHYQVDDWNTGARSYFDTEHVPGYFDLIGCKNNAGQVQLQLSAYHEANSPGGATLTRAVSLRHGNSLFQFATPWARDMGMFGPFGFKEIPAGGNAGDAAWQALSAGSTVVLQSGLSVSIAANGASISLFAAPFITMTIDNNGYYANWVSYINAAQCTNPTTNTAVCKGKKSPVDSWIFHNTQPQTITPLAPATPVIAPPPQTCPDVLHDIAVTNCDRCFPDNDIEHANCIVDICTTGNPYCPPPPCKPGHVCCNCASTGTCVVHNDNSTSCACDVGYAGRDCSQSTTVLLIDATTAMDAQMFDGNPYSLTPHNLNGYTSPSDSPLPAELIRANPWTVKNSLLVYVAATEYPTANGLSVAQHLYVVNDATSASGSLAHTLGMTYTGFDTYTGAQQTPARAGGVTLSTGRTPATATFRTNPTQPASFVIPNLPSDWCVTFTSSLDDDVAQIVLGSGNIRGQLELLRVVQDGTSFRVCGKKQADPCPSLMDCRTCTANAVCGWCRTTGQCHYGRPAGPTDGSICPAWAFTFSSTTRRITQTYGYPVSPIDTTVVLGAADQNLPIEIKVDMAYRYYNAFDIQILFPNSASNNRDLAALKTSIRDITDRLAANYLNSALSIATYSSRINPAGDANGDVVVFNQLFPLVATTSSAGIAETVAVASVNDRTSAPLLSSVAVARYAGSAGSRRYARAVMIIFATEADAASATVAADFIKPYFTRTSTMPIFVASAGAKAYYKSLVKAMGFGVVLDYVSPNSIGLAIDRALTEASGATFLSVDTNNVGRIDVADLTPVQLSLTVAGMSARMVSRNNFPIDSAVTQGDKSVILAPGFGKATIDVVPSDSPFTTGEAVHMTVGRPLDPYTAHATPSACLPYLTGAPAVVLQSTALVTASVKAVSKGKLYQFDEAALRAGAQITDLVEIVLDGSSYVTVTDVQGRVVYQPPNDNDFGEQGVAFATITYRVDDECSPSPDGTLPIFVEYANNKAPSTSAAAVQTLENQPVAITLKAVDYRKHNLRFNFPTDYLVNSDGNAALSGKLYVHTDACETAARADIIADLSASCTAVVAGTPVAGATFVDNSDGTRTTSTKFLYVPYKYANTAGIPAVYKTVPKISYTAEQLKAAQDGDDFVAQSTPLTTFGVNITAVNQAPFAYTPAEASAASFPWLSFDADAYIVPQTNCQASPNAADTKVVCTWDQNLGVDYPGIPAPVSIYTVGFDVDSDPLEVIVTSVVCPADAVLNSAFAGQPFSPGAIVNYEHASNTFAPAVTFRPSLDAAADAYCTIKYKFSDGQLTSDERTIQIDIKPVPLPPRSSDQRVFAPRAGIPTPFTFTAGAVSQRTTGAPVPHYIKRASIIACSGDTSSTLIIEPNTAPLDCASISASTPYVVEASNELDTDQGDYGFGFMHTFKGNWTATEASAAKGLTLTVVYTDDHQPALDSAPYTLSFSYRKVNQAPLLQYIAGLPQAQFVQKQEQSIGLRLAGGKSSGSIAFNTMDVDSEDGFVVLNVAHTAGGGKSKVAFGVADDSDSYVVTTDTGITAKAPIAAIQKILSTLSVDILDGGNKIEFDVVITVNDKGYSGACSQTDVNTCDKVATAVIKVNAAAGAPVAAIGLAAGAGAAALAAAGAAAIAWRALREPPTESYNPWEMDDNNEGTVMNPLFEGTGNSGGNPMFEGANKP